MLNSTHLTLLLTTFSLVDCSGGNDSFVRTPLGGGGTQSVSGTSGSSSGGTTTLGKGGTTRISCRLDGGVTEDTTWEPNAACPDGYDVPYSVTVSGTGTSLVIKPGTKLKFASRTTLTVASSASLVAVGTSDSPITFTGWQEAPGSWGGIVIESGSTDNEISNAIVEYGGQADVVSANLLVWYDTQPAQLKLSNTQLRYSKRFGLTLSENATLARFENNTITKNEGGAARVAAPSVHQLKGTGNKFMENSEDNIVRVETSYSGKVYQDVTWPNLSPAIYQVTGINGEGGEQIYVTGHLTIEPGAIFEFTGGSGIDVREGTAGLSAVGTAEAPIVFRGVDGSGWTGIGFCESSWSSNALQEVQIANAAGPTYAKSYCGSGATDNKASVLVGHNYKTNASTLRVKNVKFSGPNNGDTDIQVKDPSKVTLEGTNSGTGPDGALAIEPI